MHEHILEFWFTEIEPRDWWVKDPEFDTHIANRFAHVHEQAVAGELSAWRKTAPGRLAEIIVLDQFSRNIYRDEPEAFASDERALKLAQEAVAKGACEALAGDKQLFLLMPYMHSESIEVHQQAEPLFEALAASDERYTRNLDFERRHKVIIDRFGRYPHRNAILGRKYSVEELEFLTQPGSGF